MQCTTMVSVCSAASRTQQHNKEHLNPLTSSLSEFSHILSLILLGILLCEVCQLYSFQMALASTKSTVSEDFAVFRCPKAKLKRYLRRPKFSLIQSTEASPKLYRAAIWKWITHHKQVFSMPLIIRSYPCKNKIMTTHARVVVALN